MSGIIVTIVYLPEKQQDKNQLFFSKKIHAHNYYPFYSKIYPQAANLSSIFATRTILLADDDLT